MQWPLATRCCEGVDIDVDVVVAATTTTYALAILTASPAIVCDRERRHYEATAPLRRAENGKKRRTDAICY